MKIFFAMAALLIVSAVLIYVLFLDNMSPFVSQPATSDRPPFILTPSPTRPPAVASGFNQISQRVGFSLESLNSSPKSGSVILLEENGQTTVSLTISPFYPGIEDKASINSGTCTDLGPVKHSLNSFIEDQSQTVINTTIADLKSKLPLVIAIHQSSPQAELIVACATLSFY